jgi:hypothetical protein
VETVLEAVGPVEEASVAEAVPEAAVPEDLADADNNKVIILKEQLI